MKAKCWVIKTDYINPTAEFSSIHCIYVNDLCVLLFFSIIVKHFNRAFQKCMLQIKKIQVQIKLGKQGWGRFSLTCKDAISFKKLTVAKMI